MKWNDAAMNQKCLKTMLNHVIELNQESSFSCFKENEVP